MQSFIFSSLFFFLTGCGQDYNSNSGDKSGNSSSNNCSSAADQLYCVANAALNTNCNRCHSAWKNYKSTADWANAGLIVKANPSGSKIYSRLRNNGGDMPKDSGAISSNDLNSINQWISNAN